MREQGRPDAQARDETGRAWGRPSAIASRPFGGRMCWSTWSARATETDARSRELGRGRRPLAEPTEAGRSNSHPSGYSGSQAESRSGGRRGYALLRSLRGRLTCLADRIRRSNERWSRATGTVWLRGRGSTCGAQLPDSCGLWLPAGEDALPRAEDRPTVQRHSHAALPLRRRPRWGSRTSCSMGPRGDRAPPGDAARRAHHGIRRIGGPDHAAGRGVERWRGARPLAIGRRSPPMRVPAALEARFSRLSCGGCILRSPAR